MRRLTLQHQLLEDMLQKRFSIRDMKVWAAWVLKKRGLIGLCTQTECLSAWGVLVHCRKLLIKLRATR